MAQKIIIIFSGFIFLCVLLGYLLLSILSGFTYKRVTEGELYNRYTKNLFYVESESQKNFLSDYKIIYKGYCLNSQISTSNYLSKLTILVNDGKKINCVSEISSKEIFEVIDIYKISFWGGDRVLALCIFPNRNDLKDIVFEKSISLDYDESIARKKTKSQWTMERYNKVINSKRCNLRGIKKDIKPGNLKKKVSGSWWNFKIWKAY